MKIGETGIILVAFSREWALEGPILYVILSLWCYWWSQKHVFWPTRCNKISQTLWRLLQITYANILWNFKISIYFL